MFHPTDIPHFVPPFIHWCTVGLFLPSDYRIMSSAAIHLYTSFCVNLTFSFLLSIFLGLELIGHIVTLWGTAGLFQSDCAILHSHWQCRKVSNSPHPCQQHPLLSDFDPSSPYGCEVGSTAVLVCISLMANDFQHLFMLLLPISITSLEKCLFISFTYFLAG